MAALGWLLNLGFAGSGETGTTPVPGVFLTAAMRTSTLYTQGEMQATAYLNSEMTDSVYLTAAMRPGTLYLRGLIKDAVYLEGDI